jgi:hypothetical protein
MIPLTAVLITLCLAVKSRLFHFGHSLAGLIIKGFGLATCFLLFLKSSSPSMHQLLFCGTDPSGLSFPNSPPMLRVLCLAIKGFLQWVMRMKLITCHLLSQPLITAQMNCIRLGVGGGVLLEMFVLLLCLLLHYNL